MECGVCPLLFDEGTGYVVVLHHRRMADGSWRYCSDESPRHGLV
jgi:hypothetical protein